MAVAFRVNVPFDRRDPVSGAMVSYQAGDLIAHPDRMADIQASEHVAHGNRVFLPDHHEAVLPHLPEDHPAMKKFISDVEEGWDKEGRAEDEKVHQATARVAGRSARAPEPPVEKAEQA